MKRLLCAVAACAAVTGAGAQPAQAPTRPESLSSAAQGVYASARPRLLQIRTLLGSTDRQSSIGSGFLISADGLAVTNYHVISQYALEPETYRLEYSIPESHRGRLKLVAFDIANDLAIVQADRGGPDFFEFDKRALADKLQKGERLYSMGNPLDIGFTIVEGTYNGRVDRSYNDRIHFSGALNPGMSGGPTVGADGRVVGINVAKRLGGELVSFLVPARFAAGLAARKHVAMELSPDAVRSEIARQLRAWQAGLHKVLSEQALPSRALGPYRAPDSPAQWFTCWSRTNAEQVPKPRASLHSTACNTETSLFVAGDLSTGQVRIAHSHVKSIDLNDFQFAAFLSGQFQPGWQGWNRKRHTRTRCHEAFLEPAAADAPPVRAVWCARAYRDFEGLYDVSVLVVTQDQASQALVSRLSMQAVSYENGTAFGERFLKEIRFVR